MPELPRKPRKRFAMLGVPSLLACRRADRLHGSLERWELRAGVAVWRADKREERSPDGGCAEQRRERGCEQKSGERRGTEAIGLRLRNDARTQTVGARI